MPATGLDVPYWLGELGLPVDDAQGLHWLEAANKTGNADALYLRGDAYSKGLHGVAYDRASAFDLYQ